MSKGIRKTYYVHDKQAKFIKDLAEINFRSESFMIEKAIDLLAEHLGGYGDGADDEH